MIKKKTKLSRAEINEQSRLLKRKKKHKGLPSGSRINQTNQSTTKTTQTVSDSRIGSKKPIPLIVTETTSSITKTHSNAKTIDVKKLSPEKELQELENNPYLEQLLDMVEDDLQLSIQQQQDLNTMLDRIDELMQQIGYVDDELIEETEMQEDIMSLLKRR
ncbi:GTPase-activating protein [Frischella sp. Ac48]|uniref:Der GTPase-activating protein YihI n=1 Tax=Frischella sp. Ac48 TaxID=2804531 RepID=UPI001C7D830E|nr:Der GTPase-activating protein YihI [Frischella sp. Ac48]MBX4133216.1 GTPase-activating protein [Frischella sp. Ac48]